jgi:DNA-binding Lrp family transcriptional regulator
MDQLTQDLLNTYQRGLPLVSRPFAAMAEQLIYSEADVLSRLNALKADGIVTRVGPIFDHRRAGSSLLAAMRVPPEQLKDVAEKVNQYSEVNHNYGREHAYNLWFVVTAPTKLHLNEVLKDMALRTGFPILRLPMEKGYHIDLGFHLWPKEKSSLNFTYQPSVSDRPVADSARCQNKCLVTEEKKTQLRAMIQDGLPLIEQPFAHLANILSETEEHVISTLEYWLETGLIKRIGLVTNHHRVGFNSNAMVVWNVPDDQVDKIGEAFKNTGLVSLCYRRSRHLPEWPYNLYCMIHSRDRDTVAKHVAALVQACGLEGIDKEVLFSNCQFKQKGGQYRLSSGHEMWVKNVHKPGSNHTLNDSAPVLDSPAFEAQSFRGLNG